MSRAGGPSSGPKPTLAANTLGASGVFSYRKGGSMVELDLSGVEAMLGVIDPVVAALIVERNWDMIKHHRLGLIKDAAGRFPGKRRAQKFVAAVLEGYGRKSKQSPRTVDDAAGEIFTASRAMRDLEVGGVIRSDEPMALLFPKPFARMMEIRKQIKEKKFFITAKGEIVSKTFDDTAAFRRTGKYTVLGVMRRRRLQKPMLHFYDRFDKNLPGHMAKLDKDLDTALTTAGRTRLANRFDRAAAARANRNLKLAESIARRSTTKTGGAS